MKLRYYTDKELKILNDNIFVKEVRYKREIVYDPIFKLWCIMMRLDLPELTGKQIFERGGFDTIILHDNLPYRRIATWLNNYKKYGIHYFLQEDEPYCTKKVIKKEESIDKFKLQLLKCVLTRLKLKHLQKNIKGHILMNLILSYMNILMGKMNLQKFLFL